MSLKPPCLWIEQRGLQHRVYWRNGLPRLPARSYVPFYGRADAERFVGMAGLLGLDNAAPQRAAPRRPAGRPRVRDRRRRPRHVAPRAQVIASAGAGNAAAIAINADSVQEAVHRAVHAHHDADAVFSPAREASPTTTLLAERRHGL